ncbi:hypothetical protein ACFPRL_19000 [Pseudoclavibacter helvolus]
MWRVSEFRLGEHRAAAPPSPDTAPDAHPDREQEQDQRPASTRRPHDRAQASVVTTAGAERIRDIHTDTEPRPEEGKPTEEEEAGSHGSALDPRRAPPEGEHKTPEPQQQPRAQERDDDPDVNGLVGASCVYVDLLEAHVGDRRERVEHENLQRPEDRVPGHEQEPDAADHDGRGRPRRFLDAHVSETTHDRRATHDAQTKKAATTKQAAAIAKCSPAIGRLALTSPPVSRS